MSKLIALLPLLAFEGTDSKAGNKLHTFVSTDGFQEKKAIDWNLGEKKEGGRTLEKTFEDPGMSRLIKIYGFSGPSRIHSEEQHQQLFNRQFQSM